MEILVVIITETRTERARFPRAWNSGCMYPCTHYSHILTFTSRLTFAKGAKKHVEKRQGYFHRRSSRSQRVRLYSPFSTSSSPPFLFLSHYLSFPFSFSYTFGGNNVPANCNCLLHVCMYLSTSKWDNIRLRSRYVFMWKTFTSFAFSKIQREYLKYFWKMEHYHSEWSIIHLY